MKNFVIATVSVFALLGATAHANEKAYEMREGKKEALEMKEKENVPHHKHHKHHRHHAHGQSHALAVFVNYPPVNAAALSACPCEYYQGNQAYGYIWHEGYFWYPHARAELLAGYTPHQMRGSYWYPSRLHPHAVYVDKTDLTSHEIYPIQEGTQMGAMHHKHRGHHKGHMKKHRAKVMHHEKEMSMQKEMSMEKEKSMEK